jgi:hypothetical protein
MARVPAGELAHTFEMQPELIPSILRNLGTAIMTSDLAFRRRLTTYLGEVAGASARDTIQHVVTIVVLDPLRYDEDPGFRAVIDDALPKALSHLSVAGTRGVLRELNRSTSLDFDAFEAAAAAAGIAPRESARRRVDFDATKFQIPDDLSGPIEASIFSLSSSFFTSAEAKRFLDSVHAASPNRKIIVLGDRAIGDAAGIPRVAFLDSYSRSFTPWPRDPFSVARSMPGGVVFVNRPNVQPQRPEDRNMARAIVQQLPAALDAAWKQPRWTTSPQPFHNGNILFSAGTLWISIHSVETRALALVGLNRVPIETFNDRAAADRYREAVRHAARDLGAFYRATPRFVHSLDSLDVLGGGANIDLDSVLTILPRSDGRIDALVGDIGLGVKFAHEAPSAEWSAVRDAYVFRDEPEGLRQAIVSAQSRPASVALQRYLDEIVMELARNGLTIRRLPLLDVPLSLLTNGETSGNVQSFLMTWNNVVLEKRGARRRAEGFASILPSADRYARQVFALSGYELDLFPPLIRSIVLGGGYRCASSQVRPLEKRRAPATPAGGQ